MVLVELLVIVAGVIIVILVVIAVLSNPSGPPVAGPCGLVVRSIRKDYCSGTCPGGPPCSVTAIKPWGFGLGTQAAACACPIPITPRQPAAGDSWCVYTVKAVVGSGAIPRGGQLCIVCPVPNPSTCLTVVAVTPAEGLVYVLNPPAAGATCGVCPAPAGQTYQ
jgi:hypothetical protein